MSESNELSMSWYDFTHPNTEAMERWKKFVRESETKIVRRDGDLVVAECPDIDLEDIIDE